MTGHALLWIESLAAALVLVALVTAVTARWEWFWRWAVPVGVAVGLFAWGVAVTVFTCVLHFDLDAHPISNPQSFAAIGWTMILGIWSAILLVRGLRQSAAQAWSRSNLAIAFAALIVVTTITFSNMDLAVKVQLAALRAEAGAKALSIMPPRPPDAENAALVYQEAFDLLAPPEPVPPLWRDKADAWRNYDRSAFDPKDPELREFLRTQERGLALVRKAAAMPGCSFAYDYSQGAEMRMPELNRMRHAATVLAYDALTKSEDGDTHGALADIAAIYGVTSHVNDPVLIALLVAVASERNAAKALEDVLSLCKPTAADLAQVSLPDRASHRRALRNGLAGTDALGLASFKDFAYVTSDSPAMQAIGPDFGRAYVWAFMSPYYRLYLLSDDLAAFRRAMDELQRIAGLPYADSRQGLEAFGTFFRTSCGGMLTRLLVPSINKCVERTWAGDARRALVQTAVALAAFKAKTGSYPDKLDALVPDFLPRVPLDPYSGRPLRMKRDGAGVVIYTTGREPKDDGRIRAEPAKDEGDLAFRLR
jgi:hypothetical protein